MLIGELLTRNVEERPDAVALVDSQGELTWLRESSVRLTKAIHHRPGLEWLSAV